MIRHMLTRSTLPSERIIRPSELADRLGVSRETLWRMRHRGDMPNTIRLSPRCVGWRASDIEAWLTTREEKTGPA